MRLSKETRPKRIGDYADTYLRAFRVHGGERSDVEAVDSAIACLEKRYSLAFEIHRVTIDDGIFFAACFGPVTTVCEAPTLEECMAKLAAYRKAEGFTVARFPLKPGIVEQYLRDKSPAGLSEFSAAATANHD